MADSKLSSGYNGCLSVGAAMAYRHKGSWGVFREDIGLRGLKESPKENG